VLQAVNAWAAEQGALLPGLEREGVHGSYGRGDARPALQRECRWIWCRVV